MLYIYSERRKVYKRIYQVEDENFVRKKKKKVEKVWLSRQEKIYSFELEELKQCFMKKRIIYYIRYV